jgi:hypothetical protein
MADEEIDIFDDNPEQKESDAKRKKRRARELADIRKVLSFPEGRRFIWRMWGECNTFRSPYAHKDTNFTHVCIGKQDIGFMILDEVNKAKPDAYSQMRAEYLSELQSEKQKEKEQANDGN